MDAFLSTPYPPPPLSTRGRACGADPHLCVRNGYAVAQHPRQGGKGEPDFVSSLRLRFYSAKVASCSFLLRFRNYGRSQWLGRWRAAASQASTRSFAVSTTAGLKCWCTTYGGDLTPVEAHPFTRSQIWPPFPPWRGWEGAGGIGGGKATTSYTSPKSNQRIQDPTGVKK